MRWKRAACFCPRAYGAKALAGLLPDAPEMLSISEVDAARQIDLILAAAELRRTQTVHLAGLERERPRITVGTEGTGTGAEQGADPAGA
jgi:hypothetical protein